MARAASTRSFRLEAITTVADGIDVAVRFGVPEPSALIARKLVETRILTCASPAYLLRRGEPRHPLELSQHECPLFRNPVSGRPFPWEFHRRSEIIEVPVNGRLVLNDLASKLAACVAGHGIAQTFALGIDALLESKGAYPDPGGLGGGAVSALTPITRPGICRRPRSARFSISSSTARLSLPARLS